jgi:hypothetical protein
MGNRRPTEQDTAIDAQGAIAILQGAHALIVSGWCQGADALDAHGQAVEPWDEEATSWSLLGALVAQTEPARLETEDLTVAMLRRAVGALAEVLSAESLHEWNDDPGRSAQEVADILTRATSRFDVLQERQS